MTTSSVDLNNRETNTGYIRYISAFFNCCIFSISLIFEQINIEIRALKFTTENFKCN